MTRLVSALGWEADPAPAWREAAAFMREARGRLGPASPEAANAAKRLARACHGRLVFLYSATGPVEAVALRWRQQLNENAKLPAHSAAGAPS